MTAQEQQRAQDYARQQWNLLVQKDPEFGDREKVEKLRGALYSNLDHWGLTGEELTQFFSQPQPHGVHLILKDAVRYRESLKGKPLQEKKLKKLPKLNIKPSAKGERVDPTKQKLAEAHKAVKKARSGTQEMREAARGLWTAKLAERDRR